MDNKKLNLYYVSEEYVDYLRKYDERVPFNKSKKRPYIGVVYTYKDKNYFAPLSSPKPKHLKMNRKSIDIWKIDDGKLGIININNMIPCPKEVLTEAIPTIKDATYKQLLQNQLTNINLCRDFLYKKIDIFFMQYYHKTMPERIYNRCCNLPLLECACDKYKKDNI